MASSKPASEFSSSEALALHLLKIGAVTLSPEKPYKWASGLFAPIYCDNRLTLSFPPLRSRIADGMVRIVRSLGFEADAVVGVATAGIPHATLVADRLGLPLAYVRSSPKKHGRGNQIEGQVKKGSRIALIEDLVSTGGSSLKAAVALREAGLEVREIIAVFSYGLDTASNRFTEAGIALHTLTNLEELLHVAHDEKLLSSDQLRSLVAWQRDPLEWSGRFSA